tara:strand:+ start:636 stop:1085 length:450 start_codon:yes stop_codon:yes gene_type:complete
MRQVSKNSTFAFLDRVVKRTGNNTAITRTGFIETDNKTGKVTNNECYYMELHGNKIASNQATSSGCRAIHITLAGWNTVTTRERLGAILRILGKSNVHIVQHKHQPCLATFSGNKRLHRVIDEKRWYDVVELDHMAHKMRHDYENKGTK